MGREVTTPFGVRREWTGGGETMAERELTFTRERDTKNMVRYNEDTASGQAPVIGALYVAKTFAGSAQKVRVKIATEG